MKSTTFLSLGEVQKVNSCHVKVRRFVDQVSPGYHEVFKWTVSQDLSSPVIFVKQLILIPIYLPTKKLFQTFMNIYEDILSFSCFATVNNTGYAKRKTLGGGTVL